MRQPVWFYFDLAYRARTGSFALWHCQGRMWPRQGSESADSLKRAARRQPLLLTAGELDAAFSDKGVILFGQRHDKIMDICKLCRMDDFLFAGVQVAIGNIIADCTGKQENVLLYNADVTPQRIPRKGADVGAVNG